MTADGAWAVADTSGRPWWLIELQRAIPEQGRCYSSHQCHADEWSRAAAGGRGRGRGADRGGGRGRRGRGGRGGGKPKSQAELDAELDGYFLKDGKTAANRLDSDMDAYWADKEKAKAEAAKAGEAAAPAEETAEAAAATS